jgi:Ca2+-binding EF-hand superfamily protein
MPPIPIIGALGALAYLGFVARASLHDYEEAQSEETRMRAATGWSLAEVAHMLLDGFDSDHDGTLTGDATRGVANLASELVHVSTVERPWGTPTGGMVQRAQTFDSLEPLARQADRDHDGSVTIAEVAAVLRAYDVDGDGRLRGSELDVALLALGPQRLESHARLVPAASGA